jgi:hypothetical protein
MTVSPFVSAGFIVLLTERFPFTYILIPEELYRHSPMYVVFIVELIPPVASHASAFLANEVPLEFKFCSWRPPCSELSTNENCPC